MKHFWRILLAVACLAIPGRLAALTLDDTAPIALSGEPGKDSDIRTLTFSAAEGEAKATLQFRATPLVRCTPDVARIDPAQVVVEPKAGDLTGLVYELRIRTLPERYGNYHGTVTVANGKDFKEKLKISLQVRFPAAATLAIVPPIISLPVMRSGAPGTEPLSGVPVIGKAALFVSGLPDGVALDRYALSPLMSARGYGDFSGEKRLSRDKDGNWILQVNALGVRPDKYSSYARLGVEGSDRFVSVPVDVLVRASPWCVLALLCAGIALGRGVKFMNEHGKPLLAAQRELGSLRTRVALLNTDIQPQKPMFLAQLQRMIDDGKLAEFATALPDAAGRVALLEKIGHLAGSALASAALQQRLTRLAQQVGLGGMLAELEMQHQQLLRDAAAPVASDGLELQMKMPQDNPPQPGRWKSVRPRVLAAWGWLLELAGVVVLCLVGYEILYLGGSPTFGAHFSDYFGALVWGLGADVAARSLSALGRAVPR
ncbi:hypothetical protein [Pseudoduganella lutea]|uniref:Protein BatD n=1 Tax=Pseudoduganella lutea TaxID=321985 RepID=A0A4P6L3G1_9BURK|nr:hypothetical protein [Pseudoduganella lutea]QBE66041.1 hypothetical protein EWM63_26160 [Pseudoduganella lutea]